MSKNILVVDDDDSIVCILKMFLEKQGYRVIEAFSGEEGLKKIEECKPDFVILDIMMPGMDGWEVCKNIKENAYMGSIPVSMLSVRKGSEDRKKSFEYAHADEHLEKPIEFSILIETIERFLGNSYESPQMTATPIEDYQK